MTPQGSARPWARGHAACTQRPAPSPSPGLDFALGLLVTLGSPGSSSRCLLGAQRRDRGQKISPPVETEPNKNSLSNLLEEFNVFALPVLFHIYKILFYTLQKYFETDLSLSATRPFSSSCKNISEQVELFPREGCGSAALHLVASV